MVERVVSISETVGRTPARRWFNRIMSVLLICGAIMISSIAFTAASGGFFLVNSATGYVLCTLGVLGSFLILVVAVQSAVRVNQVFRADWIRHKHGVTK